MKKIICLLLVFMFMFTLTACGGGDKNTTSNSSEYIVDSNTVTLVNDAYKKTGEVLNDISALGYVVDYKRSMKVDDVTTAVRMGVEYDFIKNENGIIISLGEIAKNDQTSKEFYLYDDTKNIYATYAGTEYIITRNDAATETLTKRIDSLEYVDGSAFKVLDTVVVDTASGGHGFVLKYDPVESGFDVAKVFGPLYSEKDYVVKPTGLKISGIIDTEGRLVSQTVTYSYSYDYEEEVTNPNIDPDNSDAATTQKVKKTANFELVAEYGFNYNITEIAVPDGIALIPAEPAEDYKKPKELSIDDFNKLVNGTSEDSDSKKENTNKKSNNK